MTVKAIMIIHGLSPQVWGSPIAIITGFVLLRSIPTGVGEPITATNSEGSDTVYPHRCGGALAGPHANLIGCGLSPQVWGSLSFKSECTNVSIPGSIPTGVGEPFLNPMIRPST